MKIMNILRIAASLILLVTYLPAFAVQQPAEYKNATRYNLAGQVTGTISAAAGTMDEFHATRFTYNNEGLVIVEEAGILTSWRDETVEPANWGSAFSPTTVKTYTYNNRGLKISQRVHLSLDPEISQSDDPLTQYSYDDSNRLECQARRLRGVLESSACTLGPVGQYGYDRITRTTYDVFGNVEKIQKAYRTALEQDYLTYTYKPNTFLVESITDANGNRTDQQYDNLGRLTHRFYPSKTNPGVASTNDYVKYTYDNNGNILTERTRRETSDSAVTVTNQYDDLNRLVKKDYTNNTYNRDIYYGYNLVDLETFARFDSPVASNDGNTQSYDGFGNLVSATSRVDGISRALTYHYDKHNNRQSLTHPDSVTFSYTFDKLDRVTGLRVGSTSLITNISYQNNGARDTLTRNNATTTAYQFDNASRLSSFSQNMAGSANDLTNTFLYNTASQVNQITFSNTDYRYRENNQQPTPRNYNVNGLNQYTTVDGEVFDYDGNGNLTYAGELFDYEYDEENRLINTAGLMQADFVYDPRGRLSKSIIDGAVTYFLYDGDALVAEYNASGAIARRYVHGDQVDEPWVQFSGASLAISNAVYLHANHQGSIIAHTNQSGGVIQKLAYDAYGVPAQSNNSRFAYTGQLAFPELSLYYYKARFYNPRLGRFLQTDPVGYEDQMNLYAYVGNDPINNLDPTGESTVYGGTSAPIMQALRQACGGNSDCYKSVAKRSAVAFVGVTIGGLAAAEGVAACAATVGCGTVLGISAVTAEKAGFIDVPVPVTKKAQAQEVTTPYKRPSGATTKAQRESVQNQPCVDCGNIANRQVADHKKPLVQEYYETGTIDKTEMRSLDAVQPQCPTCSARQGAEMSRYSRQKKEELGL